MNAKSQQSLTAACRCGGVTFEAAGKPIVAAACYCTSCQVVGRRIEELAHAPPVLDDDGGTAFLLYRKDRVRCLTGGARLEEHRLKIGSTTRRVVASCCNSAMFLEFAKGHWLSIYRNRLPADAPPVEMRVMTTDRREGVALPGDMPNYSTHSGRFMWRLLAAWIAMGLRTPRVIEGMRIP